eukprot:13506285-Ditylum_brightwellii.AAC.1
MKNAAINNFLSNNQWGGRNGQSAINVPTLKTFTLETLHLIHANAVFTNCDAHACYDRMIGITTGLALHKAGLPLNMCTFFIKALKQIEYYMSTAYGLSTEKNTNLNNQPVHGHRQGATCSPASWTFNSDTILKIYTKEAHGCIIRDPTKTKQQERDADMFIDNQTMQHNGGRYNHNEETLMRYAHHNINLWD